MEGIKLISECIVSTQHNSVLYSILGSLWLANELVLSRMGLGKKLVCI